MPYPLTNPAHAVSQSILDALRNVVGNCAHPVALHEPCITGNAWTYVKDCLDTGWVSSVGRYVDRFEAMLCDYTGARHAVAVVNGTAALHISLQLAGVKQNDEVLVPALTFIATANAVTYCGASPHFIDSEVNSLGVNAAKLGDYLQNNAKLTPQGCVNRRTGAVIRAVIPVHIFGHPVDMDPLREVCARFRLAIVEDAAESLGSFYKGRHTGTSGLLGALSFNGNKIVTTGGGGAILTDDPKLGQLAKHLTTTARVTHPWAIIHDRVGFNYRLPNINAALGCAQIEQLPAFVERKRALAGRYAQAFNNVSGAALFHEPAYARSNYWLNTLLLDHDRIDIREPLLDGMHRSGIQARPAWALMHRLDMYASCPRMDLSVAEALEQRIISLPSSVMLGETPG